MPLIVLILSLSNTHGPMDTIIIVVNTNRKKKKYSTEENGGKEKPESVLTKFGGLSATNNRSPNHGADYHRKELRRPQRCAVTSVSMKRSPSKRGANLLPSPPRGLSLDADC